MNEHKAYGNLEIYSPAGDLMFRANEDKMRFYRKNNLVEHIGDNKYRLKFEPKGLGHYDRNKELLEPRVNHCICCGDVDLLILTKHHVIPQRFRKYFPEFLKSNNHRYVVLLCRECHNEYGDYENELNDVIACKLGVKSLKDCNNAINEEKRIITGIADTILFKRNIPDDRIDELKKTFTSRTGLEATIENLNKTRKRKYEPVADENNFGKMIVDKVENLYEFQQMWLEHFVETMQPRYLPNDLRILLEK